MPKLKKKNKLELPYWPSEDFLQKSLKMVREKGGKCTDTELLSKIRQAYWKKRAQLLAEREMKKYEKA